MKLLDYKGTYPVQAQGNISGVVVLFEEKGNKRGTIIIKGGHSGEAGTVDNWSLDSFEVIE